MKFFWIALIIYFSVAHISIPPPECKDGIKTLCKQAKHYPEKAIARALGKYHYHKHLKSNRKSFRFARNFIFTGFPNDACPTVTSHIYPQVGQNNNSQSFYIVQDIKGIRQHLDINICLGGGEENCRGDDMGESYCEQDYGYQHLTVFNEKSKKILEEHIRYPNCCKCSYKRGLIPMPV